MSTTFVYSGKPCIEIVSGQECGASTLIEGECWMPGVDFNGADSMFRADLVVCANGHRYHLIDEDDTIQAHFDEEDV